MVINNIVTAICN